VKGVDFMAVKIICPEWLDEEAKTEWNRVYKLLKKEGIEFTPKDLKTLEAYCRNYSKWKQCENILLEEGFTFSTPNGYIQARPEEAMSNKAQEKMLQCAKELGLTPAARARMGKNISTIGESKSKEEKEMEGLIS
jgi:P27 family predicted phage terminase small subunit